VLTICFSTAFGLLGSTYIGAADACCDYLNDYMVWRGQVWVVAGVVKEFAFLAEDEAFIWLCHLAGVSFLMIGSTLLSLTSSGFGSPLVVTRWLTSVSPMSISETPFESHFCLISSFYRCCEGSVVGMSRSPREHC
jgi:hypothetical protein